MAVMSTSELNVVDVDGLFCSGDSVGECGTLSVGVVELMMLGMGCVVF